ncbi:MAG: tetratricopeptide repeat protein [Chloroflexi bacterium]|nr:tetratricopeptide repeat protein [Chloroflexota bacterium]
MQAVRHTAASHAVPLRSSVSPNNLPAEASTLVGREQEIAAVTELLTTRRLLTLTGPGGIGKTRLAVRAASELLGQFPAGIWQVDLASVAGPDLVPHAVAAVLDVREEPGRPLVQTLVAWLASGRFLLILDNCEHVVDACAHLAEALLRVCSDGQVLATSREPLRAEGEIVWRVPSLAIPESGGHLPVKALVQVAAVSLFIDRARARRPDFALTPENASAVAEICRWLDGIPLAIELAAARLSALTVDQICARLDNALRLLADGRRAAPRQETMRAVFDWSHALLGEAEQVLFRRLAVFSGSFDLSAVEAVCAGSLEGVDSVDRDDVLPLLAALVDKSLVIPHLTGQVARYRLLEPVRQYAIERLAAGEEIEEVRRRYARHYAQLAEAAEPQLMSGRRPPFMARLADELANVRATLTWALRRAEDGDSDAADLGLRLSGALLWFWHLHGHLAEGRRWVDRALLIGAGASPAARARALSTSGTIAWLLDDYAAAQACLEESATLFQGLDDRRRLPYTLTVLANVAALLGDGSGSSSFDEEARALFREVDDSWGLALANYAGGLRAVFRGDDSEAGVHLERALTLFRELRDAYFVANTLDNLGDIARNRGDDIRAGSLYQGALDLLHGEREPAGVASRLHNLGHVTLRRGDARGAASLFRDALALFHQQSDQRGNAECLIGLAGVFGSLGQSEQAARLFGAAQTLLDEVEGVIWPPNRADYERNLAAVRSQLEDSAFARAWAQGAAMSVVEAIALANSDLLPPPLQQLAVAPTDQLCAEVLLLTARERDVAALVAQGLTNREIAERLVITAGTAALHVKHILAKLGFASRARVAAWAVQHDVAPLSGAPRVD